MPPGTRTRVMKQQGRVGVSHRILVALTLHDQLLDELLYVFLVPLASVLRHSVLEVLPVLRPLHDGEARLVFSPRQPHLSKTSTAGTQLPRLHLPVERSFVHLAINAHELGSTMSGHHFDQPCWRLVLALGMQHHASISQEAKFLEGAIPRHLLHAWFAGSKMRQQDGKRQGQRQGN
eukprot:766636-Hanusia_phi.AAC.2